jgi:hypothetical protein
MYVKCDILETVKILQNRSQGKYQFREGCYFFMVQFWHLDCLCARTHTHTHKHTHTHTLMFPWLRNLVAVAILWFSICVYTPMLHTVHCTLYCTLLPQKHFPLEILVYCYGYEIYDNFPNSVQFIFHVTYTDLQKMENDWGMAYRTQILGDGTMNVATQPSAV